MKAKEIVKITGGKLLSGDPDSEVDLSKISTDSRAIRKGEYFLALDGPNFRGSDFVEEALQKGASGVIAERIRVVAAVWGKVLIEVASGVKALQDIAAFHRMKFDIPVICVTGSNGKTTVKEMIAAILSKHYNVLKNEGTKNNHIGVSQTLLRLNAGHDICVLELGTNRRGEIRALAGIAQPTIAVLTNVGASHLECLKDLDGVYEEKKDILQSLDKKKGVVVLNGDDEFLSRIKGAGSRTVRYGLKESNDFSAKIVSTGKDHVAFLLNDKDGFDLKLLGVHNVYNALASIAVASGFGISCGSMRKALLEYRPTGMRLNLISAGDIEIINDSYNSNPLSMRTAIEAIKSYPAKAKWVVFGDMLELGEASVHFHRMVGEFVASVGIDGMLAFGEFSRHTISAALGAGMDEKRLWHCATHDEIVDILKEVARGGDLILIKGSRGMKMERVVEKLTSGKG